MVDLSIVEVALPFGRSMSMDTLASGWAAHVRRLLREARMDPADGAWGVHDFIAALTLRDFIAEGLSVATTPVIEAVGVRVGPVDDEFRSFTVPDEDGLVRAFVGSPKSLAHWWWDRIPLEGPVRLELTAVEGHEKN